MVSFWVELATKQSPTARKQIVLSRPQTSSLTRYSATLAAEIVKNPLKTLLLTRFGPSIRDGCTSKAVYPPKFQTLHLHLPNAALTGGWPIAYQETSRPLPAVFLYT